MARAVTPAPDGGYPNGNTAEGTNALFNLNSKGLNNTANGDHALFNNTTGSDNTADGSGALGGNTIGSDNTANGFYALFKNTTGIGNTANGFEALQANKTGSDNTATGLAALQFNTTGSANIALGVGAGFNLTTGSNNIDIGNFSSTLGSSTDVAGEANKIRIGHPAVQTATFIAGISGATVTGAAVLVDATTGQLGVATSSRRFKQEIKPMDKASEAILALRPVTFRYKQEIDPKGIPQFGLVAEEVEQVNPDLVVRDVNAKVYSVRYEAVNAMLLNEFLKQHRKAQAQEATITQVNSTVAKQEATITQLNSTVAQQQKEIKALTASLEEQAAQIQKVSDQLERAKLRRNWSSLISKA